MKAIRSTMLALLLVVSLLPAGAALAHEGEHLTPAQPGHVADGNGGGSSTLVIVGVSAGLLALGAGLVVLKRAQTQK